MHDTTTTTPAIDSAPSARPVRRARRRRLLLATLLVPLGLLTAGLATAGGAGAEEAGGPPPADTIVFVEGDAANGFGILRADGSWQFPPTDSEARAECGEYDTRLDRVRCRVEVRTWYRDLADLQQSIDHYRAALRRLRAAG